MALIFESVTLILITPVLIFLILLYLYFTRNFNFWNKLGIPYAKPLPFVGNLKEVVLLKENIGQSLQRIYNEHSDKPFVGIFAFDQPSLLIRDLDLVKNILVKDAQNFIDRVTSFDKKLDPLYGNMLPSLRGQRWRHVRLNLTPVFTPAKMRMMFYLVEICGRDLVMYLDKVTADGTPVDVKETMTRFTTDVIASCAFGINSNSLKNPDAEFRQYMRKAIHLTVMKGLAALLGFLAPNLNKRLNLKVLDDDTTDYIRRTVWETVEYREKHKVIRNDFLDSMMELRSRGKRSVKEGKTSRDGRNEASTFEIDGDEFVAQAFVIIAGGFETSGTTLSYALYELAFHPDIQRRLRAEIMQVTEKYLGELTYDSVLEMSYLDMVVSETLRKYPVAPFLNRTCLSDYKLPSPSGKGTVILPNGIAIFIPVLGIQNDPKYFPEPEKFDPERFTEDNKQNRPSYTHLPFGEGPRTCIGMRFGLIQVKMGLINVLSSYDVAACEETPVPIVHDPKCLLFIPIGKIPLSLTRI